VNWRRLEGCEHLLGNVLTDDLNTIWFCERTREVVKQIDRGKYGTCLFACGMGYLEVLKYTVGLEEMKS